MNLLLITLVKQFAIADDLEPLAEEVKAIALKYGMQLEVDFENLEEEE